VSDEFTRALSIGISNQRNGPKARKREG
jgi:hypothetical protein